MNRVITKYFSQDRFSRDLFKNGLIVLVLHGLLTTIAVLGLPDFRFKKRPDLTIEFSVVAASVDSQQTSTYQTEPVPKSVIQEKDLPKNKDGTQISKTVESLRAAINSSVAGPANAQTIDADYKAAYLNNPKPPYPPIAVRMRLEGKVILLVEVMPNGRAGKVGLETSSGHDMLDQSALKAVKEWQFAPAKKDGVIVSQVVRIPITFNLKSR